MIALSTAGDQSPKRNASKRPPAINTSTNKKRDRSISRGRKSNRSPLPDRLSLENLPKLPAKAPPEIPKGAPAVPPETTANKVDDVSPKSTSNQEVKKDNLFGHVGKSASDFNNFVPSVTIHEADALRANVHLRHPVVRVSFIGTLKIF
jgi:hypothetical protein